MLEQLLLTVRAVRCAIKSLKSINLIARSSLIVEKPGDDIATYRAHGTGIASMKMALPEKMFADADQSRLSMLRNWVLDHDVTEIEMSQRQFWNFAQLQPLAEKPWITFMGRVLRVPNMPGSA